MSREFWASWLVEPVPWWRGLQVDEAVLLFDLRAFLKFGAAGKGKRKERGIRLELIHGDWLPKKFSLNSAVLLENYFTPSSYPNLLHPEFSGVWEPRDHPMPGSFRSPSSFKWKSPGNAEDSIKIKCVQIVKFDSIPRMTYTFLYARIRTFRPCQGSSIQLT